jgi:hypothetical protein
VYDLLTLQLVWSETADKYTSFAVAPNEGYLLESAPQGWIAVTSTVASERGDAEHKVTTHLCGSLALQFCASQRQIQRTGSIAGCATL